MNMHRYESFRHRSKIATYICLALSVISLIVLIQFIDNTLLMIFAIVGLTCSSLGIFIGLYLQFYYKIYAEWLSGFLEAPVLAEWEISSGDWQRFIKAEKTQRTREYLRYWYMAPMMIIVIGYLVYSEVDDLSLDINLLYFAIGAFILTMVLLYFNMRNASLKNKNILSYQVIIRPSGFQINEKIIFWGRLLKESHDSLAESLWSTLYLLSEAERKLKSIEPTEEEGCHYIFIEYGTGGDHQSSSFIPVPDDRVDEIPLIIEGVVNSETKVSTQSPVTKRYNTSRIAKWSLGSITIISIAVGLYQFALPVYNARMADEKFAEATVLFDSGKYDIAYPMYKEVIGFHEEYPEAYINMGSILLHWEKIDSAEMMFDKALSLREEYDLALYNKGYVYYLKDNYAGTIKMFTRYHRVNPGDADSYLLVGDAFMLTSLSDSATYWYDKAYASGYRSAGLSYNRAHLFLQAGLSDLAISSYRECIDQDSTYADAYFNLAKLFNDLGKTEEAEALMLKGHSFAGTTP